MASTTPSHLEPPSSPLNTTSPLDNNILLTYLCSATAAKDALGDKIDETTHDKKADVSRPGTRSIRLHKTDLNPQVHREAI
jgi:hypothetical protein